MRKTDEIGCVDDSSAERTAQRVKEIRKPPDHLRQVLEPEASRFRTSQMMVSMASLLKGCVIARKLFMRLQNDALTRSGLVNRLKELTGRIT